MVQRGLTYMQLDAQLTKHRNYHPIKQVTFLNYNKPGGKFTTD